jgi:RNA polymerase sigma-70 factor, ECF subfamily
LDRKSRKKFHQFPENKSIISITWEIFVTQERQLIARAQRGDTAAFEALVMTHAQYVYNLALRVVRNPPEAEDLSQEAFLRAWKSLPSFRQEAQFSTWLYRIVTNLCLNRLPRLKLELQDITLEEGALDLPNHRQNIEMGLLSKEMKVHLLEAIDDLPQGYRLLITLRHLQNMSYTDIAQVTGMPLGTVKTGIFRARAMLREAIQAYEASL